MKPETMKILTVDDTPANIRLLTHYLEKQGYQVLTAEDGFGCLRCRAGRASR